MSLSGFSSAPLGKDPRRFCEGDPYRVRTEPIATSGGGFLRGPVDRRFQTQTMPPHMAYRESRDWHTDNQSSDQPYSSAGGYHSMGHPSDVPGRHVNDAYGQHTGGYHSMGHPSDVPGRHVNDAYPSSSQHASGYRSTGYASDHHMNDTYSSGRHDDSYLSSGHTNHDQIHLNSHPSSRHSEIGYPHSGRRPSLLGHPSNTQSPGHSQSKDIPQHNGFTDELSSRHHGSSPSSIIHSSSSHYSTANGPLPSREYWRPMKPHPPQDHTHRMPPTSVHDGESSHYRSHQAESTYRPHSSSYRGGPENHSFKSGSPGHAPEGYWRSTGGSGMRDRTPVSRPSQTGGWETGDPRSHPQRRSSEPSLRKNYMNSTAEDRWHNHMDRSGASYSPSISSQSSWSPVLDDSGSPRIRVPQPSPSTPDDYNSPAPDFHAESHHHHHHHHSHYHPSHDPPHFSGGHAQGSFEKERGGSTRESSLLKTSDGGRLPKVPSSPVIGKAGKVGREERRFIYSRGQSYHDRRTPVNGMSVGSGNSRDPRQAGRSRGQWSHKMVLQEHSYSKRYQEGSENEPRFIRIGPCNKLRPDFLTELKSSASKGKAARQASNSKSLTTTSQPKPASGPAQSQVAQKQPANAAAASTKSELKSSNSEKKPLSSQPASSVVKQTTGLTSSGKQPSTGSIIRQSSQTASSLSGQNQNEKVAPTARSANTTSTTHRPSAVQTRAKPEVLPPSSTAVERPGNLRIQTTAHQSDTAHNSSNSSEGKPHKTDGEEKATTPLGPFSSPDEFFLDLDPEPSGSNSNSTCCSETEDMAESRTEESDMDVEDGDTAEDADGEQTLVGEALSSDDESLTMSLPGTPRGSDVEKKGSPEKWLVSSPEPGKMRFSRLDNLGNSPESERLSVKQMTSNRIQLRNGRVLPASHLAYQAKFTSPPSSDTPTSPASSSSSPQIGRLRRSKRLAASGDTLTPQLWGMYSMTDSDSTAEKIHPSDISSDESDFDLPDFTPAQSESPVYKQSSEGRGTRGRRGRGRGRWSRRGARRGGGGARGPTRSSVEGEDVSLFGGVQFYDHKPRTREEGSILQRRLALEMEVKRNERIQSEQQTDLTNQCDANANVKDDDRGSVASESFPTSTSSLDSLPHSQSSSSKAGSLSADFSPDLIAKVKKISTARSSGDTPLHKCCRTGKFDMVRYLLMVDNAPVNVQDNAGWTPLHEATSNGHVGIAQMLLQHGADSNASARDGTRPIHDAIEIGNMDMVKLLVENGADLLVEYGERTAVEFARDHRQFEIADHIKDVIHMRQEKKAANLAAAVARNPAHQKTTPTRTTKKDKLLKQVEYQVPCIPVNGYGPGPGLVSFGEELDFPLFFVSPVIELSSKPYLPSYNFQISPPGTSNPRRHNFYLMDDLLEALGMTEDQFMSECRDVNILELTVTEFLHRMKVSPYNLQVSVPDKVKALPKKKAIKFVPLCRMLSRMLDILTENMDN